jgi:hypothetical protein
MYVNYLGRYVKKGFEKPTVGILLCKEKNDRVVELTLPDGSNIYTFYAQSSAEDFVLPAEYALGGSADRRRTDGTARPRMKTPEQLDTVCNEIEVFASALNVLYS